MKHPASMCLASMRIHHLTPIKPRCAVVQWIAHMVVLGEKRMLPAPLAVRTPRTSWLIADLIIALTLVLSQPVDQTGVLHIFEPLPVLCLERTKMKPNGVDAPSSM